MCKWRDLQLFFYGKTGNSKFPLRLILSEKDVCQNRAFSYLHSQLSRLVFGGLPVFGYIGTCGRISEEQLG